MGSCDRVVDPLPSEDRRRGARLLAGSFVGLVAISAGMSAVYGGATPIEIALLSLVGAIVGAVVLFVLGVGR